MNTSWKLYFSLSPMQSDWSETAHHMLKIVQRSMATGVECGCLRSISAVDLRVVVAARMMRWSEILTVRCLALDTTVEDAVETECVIQKSKALRQRLMAGDMTLEKLVCLLQDVTNHESNIMAVIDERGVDAVYDDAMLSYSIGNSCFEGM